MKIIIFLLKTLNFVLIAWMLMSLTNTAFNIKSVHKPRETQEARAFLFTIAFITPIILIDKARDRKKEKECAHYEKIIIDAMVKERDRQKRIAADPEAYFASDEHKQRMEKYDKEINQQYIREHFPELADKFIKKD